MQKARRWGQLGLMRTVTPASTTSALPCTAPSHQSRPKRGVRVTTATTCGCLLGNSCTHTRVYTQTRTYIHARICARAHTLCVHTRSHTYAHTHTRAHMHAVTHVHIHAHTCTRSHTCTDTRAHVHSKYVRAYTCTCVCVYIHAQYMHAYTQTACSNIQTHTKHTFHPHSTRAESWKQ